MFSGLEHPGRCSPDVSHPVSLITKKEVWHLWGLFGFWSQHIIYLRILLELIWHMTWEVGVFEWNPGERSAAGTGYGVSGPAIWATPPRSPYDTRGIGAGARCHVEFMESTSKGITQYTSQSTHLCSRTKPPRLQWREPQLLVCYSALRERKHLTHETVSIRVTSLWRLSFARPVPHNIRWVRQQSPIRRKWYFWDQIGTGQREQDVWASGLDPASCFTVALAPFTVLAFVTST